MTKVYVSISKDVYMIEFIGHATGSPETCSGISAIMFSLEGFLRNHEEDLKEHRASIPEDNTDAVTYIRFASTSEEIQGAFEMALIGLLQIQKSYPKYCKVTVV